MNQDSLNGLLNTHEVENQPPIIENYNVFTSDRHLQKALDSQSQWKNKDHLTQFGEYLGKAETLEHSFNANRNKPVFHSHDRQGNRIDYVDFHPSYHHLFSQSVKYGVHCLPWESPEPGAHVARAALLYMDYQLDQGHICPVTMTYGCVRSMQRQPEVWNEWKDKVLSYEYDPSFQPISKKSGAIIGMAMTEKQGGSDIRSNTTTATPVTSKGPGQEYLLSGHKWFCSHPMGDGFLMLAKTEGGLSCFFVPRFRPDGSKNNIFIQRLKDKLGDHSNASSEIELKNTWGRMVGEEGRGVPIIIEMANYTRLDCAVAASSLMRQSLMLAIQHTNHRQAFGARLVDQPIMQRLLADLSLESQAAVHLSLRMARAYDHQDDSEFEGPFRRIATAVAKYFLTKRSVNFVYECMEAHGGAGYVEESILPRLYRQAPLNSIWEGSGNVMCLDVLRAMHKEPESVAALRQELAMAAGKNDNYDRHLRSVEGFLKDPTQLQSNARAFVEKLALALQAKLMIEHASDDQAAAFCESRLGSGPLTLGQLTGNYNFKEWIQESACQTD